MQSRKRLQKEKSPPQATSMRRQPVLPKLSNDEIAMLSPGAIVAPRGAIATLADPSLRSNPTEVRLEAASPQALAQKGQPIKSTFVDDAGEEKPRCQGTYLLPTSTTLAQRFPFHKLTRQLSLGEVPSLQEMCARFARTETKYRDQLCDEEADVRQHLLGSLCQLRTLMAKHEANFRSRMRTVSKIDRELSELESVEQAERAAAVEHIITTMTALRNACRRIGKEISLNDAKIAMAKQQREDLENELMAAREQRLSEMMPVFRSKVMQALELLELWIRDCAHSDERRAFGSITLQQRDAKHSLTMAVRWFKQDFFTTRYKALEEEQNSKRAEIEKDAERIERHRIRSLVNADRQHIREAIVLPRRLAEVEASEAALRRAKQAAQQNQLFWHLTSTATQLAPLWHSDYAATSAASAVCDDLLSHGEGDRRSAEPSVTLETVCAGYLKAMIRVVSTSMIKEGASAMESALPLSIPGVSIGSPSKAPKGAKKPTPAEEAITDPVTADETRDSSLALRSGYWWATLSEVALSARPSSASTMEQLVSQLVDSAFNDAMEKYAEEDAGSDEGLMTATPTGVTDSKLWPPGDIDAASERDQYQQRHLQSSQRPRSVATSHSQSRPPTQQRPLTQDEMRRSPVTPITPPQ